MKCQYCSDEIDTNHHYILLEKGRKLKACASCAHSAPRRNAALKKKDHALQEEE